MTPSTAQSSFRPLLIHASQESQEKQTKRERREEREKNTHKNIKNTKEGGYSPDFSKINKNTFQVTVMSDRNLS